MSLALLMSFSRSFYQKSPRVTLKCGFATMASISADLVIAEVVPRD